MLHWLLRTQAQFLTTATDATELMPSLVLRGEFQAVAMKQKPQGSFLEKTWGESIT